MELHSTLLVLGAVALGAFTKSITGLGMPMVAIPALATVVGLQRAVLIIALPTFVTNVWLILVHRGHLHGLGHVVPMVLTGAVGAAVGSVALTRIDPRWTSAVLGLLIVTYLTMRLTNPRLRIPHRAGMIAAPFVGALGGLMQGAAGISGPVLVPYLDGLRLSREAFILSLCCTFQTFTLVQMGTFASLGRYNVEDTVLSVLALVPVAVGFPLGIRLAHRIHQRWFERVILVFLAVMAVELLLGALAGG